MHNEPSRAILFFYMSSLQISLRTICAANIFGYQNEWSFVLEFSTMPDRYQILHWMCLTNNLLP